MSETEAEAEAETARYAIVNGSVERGIPRRCVPLLIRELAANEMKRTELARKYGVARATITEFAKRHAAEIADAKDRLDDEFAATWIAGKAQRIAAYQADYEMALNDPRASHHDWVRARTQILLAVAEELGQMPPKMQVSVMPVVHIIEGVNVEDLK
jgi:hypothetical protein